MVCGYVGSQYEGAQNVLLAVIDRSMRKEDSQFLRIKKKHLSV